MAAPLGRLVIYTSRIDEMADFYAKHFGFSVLRADHDRVVELSAQNSGMALLLHPASANQKEGQVLVKLVFDVEDVSAFCETARANGLDFGKIHKADGYEFANAKDPSRNSIQVSSRAFRH
ncbi:MAG: VOC family protein [Tabrizicola sp.]|nr:VOC family protein [Tabrizicola sp.]